MWSVLIVMQYTGRQSVCKAPQIGNHGLVIAVCLEKIRSSRGHRLIVLSVASSAMAALILIDGQTTHSILGIPIPINEASFFHIKKNSEKADMLRQTSLIIWDEAAMQSRLAIEAVAQRFP